MTLFDSFERLRSEQKNLISHFFNQLNPFKRGRAIFMFDFFRKFHFFSGKKKKMQELQERKLILIEKKKAEKEYNESLQNVAAGLSKVNEELDAELRALRKEASEGGVDLNVVENEFLKRNEELYSRVEFLENKDQESSILDKNELNDDIERNTREITEKTLTLNQTYATLFNDIRNHSFQDRKKEMTTSNVLRK